MVSKYEHYADEEVQELLDQKYKDLNEGMSKLVSEIVELEIELERRCNR